MDFQEDFLPDERPENSREKTDHPLCNVTGRLEALNNGSCLVTKKHTRGEKSSPLRRKTRGTSLSNQEISESYSQTFLLSKI